MVNVKHLKSIASVKSPRNLFQDINQPHKSTLWWFLNMSLYHKMQAENWFTMTVDNFFKNFYTLLKNCGVKRCQMP